MKEIEPAPCGCRRWEMEPEDGQFGGPTVMCEHKDATCKGKEKPTSRPKKLTKK